MVRTGWVLKIAGSVVVIFVTTVALVALAQGAASLHAAEPGDGLFRFVETIQVTPDDAFQTGSFPRVNYVPATNRFVVTFGVKNKGALGECLEAGYAYKEFHLNMKPTGKADFFLSIPGACEANDSGSLMVGNDYYFVWVPADEPGFYGWKVLKYDALNWTILNSTLLGLSEPYEKNNDPMVSSASGRIDVSGQYDEAGSSPPLEQGAATHHTFITPDDLQVVEKRVLAETPHICGSSMIFADGFYHMVTADAFVGDLIVMTYDSQWNYVGMKPLRSQAHWSQGIAYDGTYFYVAYLDTSQRNTPRIFPIILNAHLAAFDRDWNLVEDVAVTDFLRSDHKLAGRPWVTVRKKELYVSYDVDTIDPATNLEKGQWQAFVSVYKLKQ